MVQKNAQSLVILKHQVAKQQSKQQAKKEKKMRKKTNPTNNTTPITFKEISRSTSDTQVGCMPIDLEYTAQIVLEDPQGRRYYLQAVAASKGNAYRLFNENQKAHFDKLGSIGDDPDFEDILTPEEQEMAQEYYPEDDLPAIYYAHAVQEYGDDDLDPDDPDSDYLEPLKEAFMLYTGFAIQEYPDLVQAQKSRFYSYYQELDAMLDNSIGRVLWQHLLKLVKGIIYGKN